MVLYLGPKASSPLDLVTKGELDTGLDAIVAKSVAARYRTTAIPSFGYGDSYFTNTSQLSSADKLFFPQLMAALNALSYDVRGQGGNQMQDVAFNMIGETGKTWTHPAEALVFLNAMINDAMLTQNLAPGMVSFKESLRTVLRILRASVRHESHAATLTGTWSTDSTPASAWSAGSIIKSTVVGSTATFTVTNTDSAALLLYAFNGSTGATVDVAVNGTNYVTGLSLANTGAPSRNHPSTPYVPLTLMTPQLAGMGPHTVKVTHKAAGTLAVDCVLATSYSPPTVVINLAPQPTLSGWRTNGDSDPNAYDGPRHKFRQAIRDVVDEFPKDGKIILADVGVGWLPSLHMGADGLHYNDFGAERIVKNILHSML